LSFPLDSRQSIEFLLTTAVSAFALLLISKRLITWKAGAILLVLFILHLFFPDPGARLMFAFLYFGLAGALIVMDWRRVRHLFGDGLE